MEPIGMRTVQSILRSATQYNLSHFHTAGMSAGASFGGQLIKPTVADAMDSKYNTRNTGMLFKVLGSRGESPSNERRSSFLDLESPGSRYRVGLLRKSLVGKTMMWFVRMIRSSITGFPAAESIWYEASNTQIAECTILRFYIHYGRLMDHGLTLSELALAVFKNDVPWHVSPDFMGMIDIEVQDNYVSPWLSRTSCHVCGSLNVTSCNVIDPTAITNGSDILAASRTQYVDKTTIISSNVADILKHLGIEAASKALQDIIGSNIIADFMTRTGQVLPFFKYSTEVRRKGILASTGFERPRNDIVHAISSGTHDTHVSVYSDIMTGKDPSLGFHILLE